MKWVGGYLAVNPALTHWASDAAPLALEEGGTEGGRRGRTFDPPLTGWAERCRAVGADGGREDGRQGYADGATVTGASSMRRSRAGSVMRTLVPPPGRSARVSSPLWRRITLRGTLKLWPLPSSVAM